MLRIDVIAFKAQYGYDRPYILQKKKIGLCLSSRVCWIEFCTKERSIIPEKIFFEEIIPKKISTVGPVCLFVGVGIRLNPTEWIGSSVFFTKVDSQKTGTLQF